MSKVKYVKLEVSISEDYIPHISVPEWEVPILRIVHGKTGPGGSVDPIKVVEHYVVDRGPPDAYDEYKRLSDRYKRSVQEDGSPGPVLVAMVYGAYGVGQERLRQAIEAATVADGYVEAPVEQLAAACDLV